MTLSIITINYNNCEGLKRTIDSVVSQSFKDYEWIVIDGGSTDGSREMIEQHADLFSFWCSEPDKGIYNAMNKGIKHAKGEWLQFLNSGDCIYNSSTLQTIFKESYNADVLYGNVIYSSPAGEYLTTFPKELSLSYLVKMFISHQSSFYRRTVFDDYPYDESYKIVSDWLYHIQLILRNKRFVYLPITMTICDNGGITIDQQQLNWAERQKVILNTIPEPIMRDLNYVEKYIIFNKRKSLKIISSFSVKLCQIIDQFLTLIEKLTLRKR